VKCLKKEEFLWGVATSSYQIEGGVNADGRTPSIWDTFAKTPGKVVNGDNGDIACDHYHRYQEDVRLMKDLGINSYRFSVAWPRIFPEKGKYNPKGLDFYKRLIEKLLENNIKPMATIYHWDLPQWADDLGGWLKRDVTNWYLEYAAKLFRELGDVVPLWITHNEPWCASMLGYFLGEHAPGHKDLREGLIASHNILLSHGLTVEAFRQTNLKNSQIGITLNLQPAYPATEKEEDVMAARLFDGFFNRWFLDPLFKARYPNDMLTLYSNVIGKLDFIKEEDLKKISLPIDFLGVNYYTRTILKYNPLSPMMVEQVQGTGKVTDMGWEVYPEGLYQLLNRLQSDYTKIPLYITENGAAFPDQLSSENIVHDTERITFLQEHFAASLRFRNEGGNLKGYYVWSFLDNFEWAYGYSKRFGITYVDYATQKRILKDSALWYKEFIAQNM